MQKLVDIDCEIRSDVPDKAAIAIFTGEFEEHEGQRREKWTWLPRQHVENNGDGTVTIPEWLALDKGLI